MIYLTKITTIHRRKVLDKYLFIREEFFLQVLANAQNHEDPFAATVDVKDGEGHTVLQAAVEAAWVPGVCVALEAGADVTLKVNYTVLLIAP